ncbi:MAG: hypothetical protein EBU90_06920 [Proteobacteria bacterium]|jgi:hypothetical protein|nr:hypothetical protein [Pseudomonadota bacterium]NBP14020.1 hypothetical protein [bacterium]
MSVRAKGLKAKLGWGIHLLTEAKDRLKKFRATEDHTKNLKLKSIQIRIDTCLLLAKELSERYGNRKED